MEKKPAVKFIQGHRDMKAEMISTLESLGAKNFSEIDMCDLENPNTFYTVDNGGVVKAVARPRQRDIDSGKYKQLEPHKFLFESGDKVRIIGGTNKCVGKVLTIRNKMWHQHGPAYTFPPSAGTASILEKNLELVEKASATAPLSLFDEVNTPTTNGIEISPDFRNKIGRSMLAMAQISQLLPYYGGEITDEEWSANSVCKYTLVRIENEIETCEERYAYEFLAFHTPEQRDEFLKNNEQLVRDYLMLD